MGFWGLGFGGLGFRVLCSIKKGFSGFKKGSILVCRASSTLNPKPFKAVFLFLSCAALALRVQGIGMARNLSFF